MGDRRTSRIRSGITSQWPKDAIVEFHALEPLDSKLHIIGCNMKKPKKEIIKSQSCEPADIYNATIEIANVNVTLYN